MDVRGATRFALIACLLLLVQAAVPPALAHGGDDHGAEGAESDDGAFVVTSDRPFAEQRNPDMSGPRVVWQERLPSANESWDIAMADLSEENVSALDLTNTDYDEKDPVIGEHLVAWEAYPGGPTNRNIVVLDLQTGRIHHVPDEGDENSPAFGGDGLVYYVSDVDDGRFLRAFDPVTGSVSAPIDNRSITGEPAAHGDWIAWAEGASTSAKIYLKNTETGEVEKVTGLFNLREGLTMGPAGVAWIARYGGQFERGEYATLYNLSTGLDKFRSHVYPHSNIESCETGVIWDQPGTATTDTQAVALRDRFVNGTVTFGNSSYSGTCGGDHIVFEQTVRGQAGSEGSSRQLWGIDLRDVRLHREALITIDDDDRRSVLSAPDTFRGTAQSPDPREPIDAVFVSVDGTEREKLNITETEQGVAWEATIDPAIMEPGRHELEVLAVDALGRVSRETFTFYTETPYQIEPSGEGPNIPTEEEAPFPLNIVNHYQDYQPFYNTVFLALALLAVLAWWGYRRYEQEPIGTPEYVPPEDP
jgi:hypothetical protein